MTQKLAGLLRLQERHVQNAKAELGEQSTRVAALDARRRAHAAEAAAQPFAELAAVGLSLDAWRKRQRAERGKLDNLHADARAQQEYLRDALRDKSAEKLAVERVAERMQAEQDRLQAVRSQHEMDDMVAGRWTSAASRTR